ncbi:biotin-dependent carboxyltransferase family protein [Desulfogranum marinum]|uniref:5-oxoprolinase subunit C family protein n=1 Tax=Desulfogranum marinum TaxID=453220 RepID=UPI0029C977DA|nr:biotin-dependent carboxyltransferase family protein [Desulfogranum marinum]
MPAAFKISRPGAYSTVQDLGRFGYQRYGVPPSGALDRFAAQTVNVLLGNHENCAVLEMTMSGPVLEILAPCTLAVTGAAMPITLNATIVKNWSSFPVVKGDVVTIGHAEAGCRAYLGINGGIDVPVIMGSRSCYTDGRLGGHEGRPLLAGDTLASCEQQIDRDTFENRVIPVAYRPTYSSHWELRAIPGPQDDYFDQGLELFFSQQFTITPQANRMGYRLKGPTIERKKTMPASIISEPSLPGGVQIPEGGDPIILLSEQTVGGYAKIATVIRDDIAKIAQAMPGDTIRFRKVSIEEARDIERKNKELLSLLQDEYSGEQSFAVLGKQYYKSEIFNEKIMNFLRQI